MERLIEQDQHVPSSAHRFVYGFKRRNAVENRRIVKVDGIHRFRESEGREQLLLEVVDMVVGAGEVFPSHEVNGSKVVTIAVNAFGRGSPELT